MKCVENKTANEPWSKWGWVLVSLCVFLFSLGFAPLYIGGDQGGYIRAYEAQRGLTLAEGWYAYEHIISTAERVHFLVVWTMANFGIDKNLVMAIANAALAASMLKLFERLNASFWISALIVLTNFYLLVLYFAAERLKFAFLFLALSMWDMKRPHLFVQAAFVAIWAHFSVLLLYAGMLLVKVQQLINGVKDGGRGWGDWRWVLFPLVVIGLTLAYERNYLLWKAYQYVALSAELSFSSFIAIFLLGILSIVYAPIKWIPIAAFTPMIVAVALFGDTRINMLAYFVFLYFGLQHKGGWNVGVLATCTYLGWKSIGFVSSVLNHGHGFHENL